MSVYYNRSIFVTTAISVSLFCFFTVFAESYRFWSLQIGRVWMVFWCAWLNENSQPKFTNKNKSAGLCRDWGLFCSLA